MSQVTHLLARGRPGHPCLVLPPLALRRQERGHLLEPCWYCVPYCRSGWQESQSAIEGRSARRITLSMCGSVRDFPVARGILAKSCTTVLLEILYIVQFLMKYDQHFLAARKRVHSSRCFLQSATSQKIVKPRFKPGYQGIKRHIYTWNVSINQRSGGPPSGEEDGLDMKNI